MGGLEMASANFDINRTIIFVKLTAQQAVFQTKIIFCWL